MSAADPIEAAQVRRAMAIMTSSDRELKDNLYLAMGILLGAGFPGCAAAVATTMKKIYNAPLPYPFDEEA